VQPSGPLPIAFLLTRAEPGGTERQMIELIRRLDPARWRVHLAFFQAQGAWLHRATEAAASTIDLGITSFRSRTAPARFWRFVEWCRTNRIAVLHTTELYSNTFGLPAGALAGVPARIGNRREINPDKTPAQVAAQRAAYACSHRVVANSHAAADRLRWEHVPARKIAVIPNGVLFPREQARQARDRNKVVMVANLRPEKGHDVLLDAAAILRQRFPKVRFDIVGDGPERDRLIGRSAELGLSGIVSFLGHRDDVPALLAGAGIFVLPSRSEAFPNALLEAMAAGLAIVATRVGGIPELIDDEQTGLLVPPDRPGALADRIGRLLAQPTVGMRLGEAARLAVATRYSFERMVGAFEALYLTELTRRGAIAARQLRLAAS
jgi:glycosyltransferase involved in cell wall biosynthesis